MLEMPVICRAQFYTLEAVDGGFCLLEVLEVMEVMRRVLLYTLEAVESGFCLLEILELIRSVLLCMLWTVGCVRGGVGGADGDAPYSTLVFYSVRWRLWRAGSVCWRYRR